MNPPRPLRVAVQKELRLIVRDGRFRIALVAFFALFAGSLLIGLHDASEYAESKRVSEEIDEHLWMTQGDKDPHSASHYGQYVFRPRSGLQWMDRGVHDFVGVALFLESHEQGLPRHRQAESASLIPAIADLSPSRIILVFVPLLVIVLGFGSVSLERERGTLALLLGNGGSFKTLIAGKALALGMVTMAILAVPFLLGLAGVLLSDADKIDSVLRLVLLFLAFAVHTLFYVCLSLAASRFFRHSSTALIALLIYWIGATLVVPRIVNDWVTEDIPLMTNVAYDTTLANARRDGIDGNDPRSARQARLREEVLSQYGKSDISELPINYSGVSLQAGEDYDNLIFDRLYSEIYGTLRQRSGERLKAALLGPQMAAAALSMSLSGSDLSHDLLFLNEAESHRRAYVKALNDDLIHGEVNEGESRVAGAELWQKTRAPEYASAPLSQTSADRLLPWVLLCAWFLASMGLLALSTRPIDLK
ncbi:MAG TPA: DUF3526 domain-containing protein [Planctomycetota bacterium]|nr:DUF3526 domain-containing protein [Planctomycetota bacterium]